MNSTKDFRRVARAAVRYVRSLELSPEDTDAALEELMDVVEAFTAPKPKKPEVAKPAESSAAPAESSPGASASIEAAAPVAERPKKVPVVEVFRKPPRRS
ncbi:MAG: hypothetical protein HYV07_33180 [Deltaproteobacteria bacterium]|nr:hypothetical protein [Deltaproteobacteria bacterium]